MQDRVVAVSFRKLVESQPPKSPPVGQLEQVAGLLVARAAAGDPVVQRALRTRWGLDSLANEEMARCHSRTRAAYLRLRRLAASTGTPDVVVQAVELVALVPEQRVHTELWTRALSSGEGGAALVEGLRQVYRIEPPASVAWKALAQRDQAQWQQLVRTARRVGVLELSPARRQQKQAVAWLVARGLLTSGKYLVVPDDKSRLSRLVGRQLVRGSATIDQLLVGLRRTNLIATPSAAALVAWSRAQSNLVVVDNVVQAELGTASAWQTREDSLLTSCFDQAAAVHRGELIAAGVASGRSTKAMEYTVARSPILRSAGMRGYYRLLGKD